MFLVETWKAGNNNTFRCTFFCVKGKTSHFILHILIGEFPVVLCLPLSYSFSSRKIQTPHLKILHQNPLTKSHQAPFIDASVKESWLPKQFRKCRWVTWLTEGGPQLGFAGLGFLCRRFWGTFLFQKRLFIERKNQQIPWSFMKFGKNWKKGCFFVLKKKHCSLQQIMKFQKGVLFKNHVHWKKLMTEGMFFFPKVCGLNRVCCQCTPLKVPSSAQFLVPKGNQRFNKTCLFVLSCKK